MSLEAVMPPNKLTETRKTNSYIIRQFQSKQVFKWMVTAANLRLKWDNADRIVRESDGEKPGPLLTGWDTTKSHTDHTAGHLLAFSVLIQLTSLQQKHIDRSSFKQGGEWMKKNMRLDQVHCTGAHPILRPLSAGEGKPN